MCLLQGSLGQMRTDLGSTRCLSTEFLFLNGRKRSLASGNKQGSDIIFHGNDK